MKVVLAGQYPDGVFDKLKDFLSDGDFEVSEADTEEKYQQITDADILILRIFKAPEEVFARNKNLKLLMRWGAGFDSVDLEAASKRGVLVTNTPGANAGAVAELAALFMLALGRKLFCHSKSLQSGHWSKNTFLDVSFTLNKKKVGIIGGGNIGRQTARMVQAFGAQAFYFDVFRLSEAQESEYGLQYMPFKRLIAESDIITLHVPLTEKNYHIIGSEEISSMKKGAILINVSRGGLVDEKSLLQAIESGRLAGAGIDCVEHEPLHADDPLLHNPNVIITPHIGGGTADLSDSILPMLVKDIKDYAAGKPVEHIVNK